MEEKINTTENVLTIEEKPNKFKKPQRSQLIVDDQIQRNIKISNSQGKIRSATVLKMGIGEDAWSRSNIILNPNYISTKITTSEDEPVMPIDPLPGVPIGLELLVPVNYICVKLRPETDKVMISVDDPLSYEICDARGQRMYYATEKPSGFTSFHCLGSLRPFELSIIDYLGRTVLRLKRPCDWKLYCTMLPCFCCIFGSIGGNMTVSLENGSQIGEIVHKFHCCTPVYKVLDGGGNHIMTIRGNCGPDCCMYNCCRCQDIEFRVTRPNDITEIGNIAQGYAGTRNNLNMARPRLAIEDEDGFLDFGVVIPRDMHVKSKALMLAASFLVHFMYYEVPRPDRKHHHELQQDETV